MHTHRSAPRFSHDVDLVGNRLYVSSSDHADAGLYIYDISDPSVPDSLGSYSYFRGIWSTYIQGNFAYFAIPSFGLEVVDISDPTNPIQTDWWQNPNNGKILGVCVVDTIVYLANGNTAEHTYIDYYSGIYTLSVAEPESVSLLGNLEADGRVSDVAVQGGLAFVANWEPDILIADVSNPALPITIGSTPDDDFDASFEIDVEGNLAVVSGWGRISIL
ncbi:MAG: hypothetical protein IPP40_02700 [bacterium]|nr:hypothetical protein [bacterium]